MQLEKAPVSRQNSTKVKRGIGPAAAGYSDVGMREDRSADRREGCEKKLREKRKK